MQPNTTDATSWKSSFANFLSYNPIAKLIPFRSWLIKKLAPREPLMKDVQTTTGTASKSLSSRSIKGFGEQLKDAFQDWKSKGQPYFEHANMALYKQAFRTKGGAADKLFQKLEHGKHQAAIELYNKLGEGDRPHIVPLLHNAANAGEKAALPLLIDYYMEVQANIRPDLGNRANWPQPMEDEYTAAEAQIQDCIRQAVDEDAYLANKYLQFLANSVNGGEQNEEDCFALAQHFSKTLPDTAFTFLQPLMIGNSNMSSELKAVVKEVRKHASPTIKNMMKAIQKRK
ncbi:hypothetical protein [Parendozoicomonas haliclonae]|uniref:Uncharacterized protein n=1 Tax=Parendozoicomonas haliclonae TaxID=1960125 RepID=A0A1X7AGG5_9GAMM|nr:hypothetical protein [Parendozoicomonas haliclonae]SMA33038.1 hypothetical protein EHSB41UT_00219 [Parendozoicomonas haliclonae]